MVNGLFGVLTIKYINMKELSKILVIIVWILTACEEQQQGQFPVDSTPPKPVENLRVEKQFGGGVSIRYDLPDDRDLLYVVARYKIDTGAEMEVKASMYETGMDIAGFSIEEDRTIEVRAVDRSQNESSPQTLVVRPLRSPIHDIFESIQARSDFGGIRLEWQNETEAPVTILVSKPIAEGSTMMEQVTSFPSSVRNGSDNVRGFPSDPIKFFFQVRDYWGNLSNTFSDDFLPLYEEECNKALFRTWNGDPDITRPSETWALPNIWDGLGINSSNSNGYHSRAPMFDDVTKLPAITFDLGQIYTLSRFKIWHRGTADWVFAQHAPLVFQIYGSPHPNVTRLNDNSEDPAVQNNKWIFLGEWDDTGRKPSGLPVRSATAEDVRVAGIEGLDYLFPSEYYTPIRYIRLEVLENYENTRAICFMEISLWGQPESDGGN